MKPEELLKAKGITEKTQHHAYSYLYKVMLEMAQEIESKDVYIGILERSCENIKSGREQMKADLNRTIEKWKEAAKKISDINTRYVDEIERLQKRIEELETKQQNP